MSEYLLSVIGVVLFSSVLLAILPSGKTSELIKAIARIACLVTILAPIVSFFVGRSDFAGIFQESGIELQASFIEYCSEERIAEAEALLKKELKDKYPQVRAVEAIYLIQEEEIGSVVAQRLYVEKIIVYISAEEASVSEAEIKNYVTRTYGCAEAVICNDKMVNGE